MLCTSSETYVSLRAANRIQTDTSVTLGAVSRSGRTLRRYDVLGAAISDIRSGSVRCRIGDAQAVCKECRYGKRDLQIARNEHVLHPARQLELVAAVSQIGLQDAPWPV